MAENPLDAAVELLRQRRYDEGVAALSALVDDPEHRLFACGYRAYHYLQTGRYDEALADYAVMQELAPGLPKVDCCMAVAMRGQGRYHDAIRQACRALEVDPANAEARDIIVGCHAALGIGPQPVECPEPAPFHPLNHVIQQLEDQPDVYPTSVFPEVARLLYGLVRMLRPRIAIETGTYVGYSGLYIAQALAHNDAGHLHSFDLFPPLTTYRSPLAPSLDDAFRVATIHFSEAGLSSRVTLHRGDSAEGIRRMFHGREQGVDFAFIDGDHRIVGCRADWLAVLDVLAPGGVVVLHDTEPNGSLWMGPRFVVEQASSAGPETFGVVRLPTLDGYGVAIVQKHASPGDRPNWRPSLRELVTEYFQIASHPRKEKEKTEPAGRGVLRLVRNWLRTRGR